MPDFADRMAMFPVEAGLESTFWPPLPITQEIPTTVTEPSAAEVVSSSVSLVEAGHLTARQAVARILVNLDNK